MKGYPRQTPYDIGVGDPKVPYAAEEDVTEIVAWCDRCDDERRFVLQQVDVSAAEEASDMPSVYHAVEGETGWVCEECGKFRRDPVSEAAYDWAYSNVGYHKENLEGEEDTVREAASEGVKPAERVRDHPVPGEFEEETVDANRNRRMREGERFKRYLEEERG